MPTYVYRREDGTVFETVQKITDPPLTVDPDTGQQVQRVISGGAGLQFKGSGFYLTDYARKPEGGPKDSGDGATKETKTEAKPAAAEAKPAKPAAKSDD